MNDVAILQWMLDSGKYDSSAMDEVLSHYQETDQHRCAEKLFKLSLMVNAAGGAKNVPQAGRYRTGDRTPKSGPPDDAKILERDAGGRLDNMLFENENQYVCWRSTLAIVARALAGLTS